MNNRKILIIILIVIIALVVLIGAVFISSSNGEVVIDNVAGVDNVTLPAENFSAGGNIPLKGFTIVHYKPLGKDIHFYDLNISDTGYTDLVNTAGLSGDLKNISGITGTLNYYSEAKSLVFVFEVNNKLYSIDVMFVEENQVDEAENAISILLSAWLKASGYKQTDSVSNSTENTSLDISSNDNSNNSSWDPDTGKGTPTYEEMKDAANAKGDDDFSYKDYKDNMKNWDPNEEHIG